MKKIVSSNFDFLTTEDKILIKKIIIEKVDPEKTYSLSDALEIMQSVKSEKFEESIKSFSVAYDLNKSSTYLINRAVSLINLKDYASAEKDLNTVLSKENSNGRAYELLGSINRLKGKNISACELWEKGILAGSEESKRLKEKYCITLDIN